MLGFPFIVCLKQIFGCKRIGRRAFSLVVIPSAALGLWAHQLSVYTNEMFELNSSCIVMISILSVMTILICTAIIKRHRDIGKCSVMLASWIGVFYLVWVVGGWVGVSRFEMAGIAITVSYLIAQYTLLISAVYFMFKAGERGRNRFGDDPRWMCEKRVKLHQFVHENAIIGK